MYWNEQHLMNPYEKHHVESKCEPTNILPGQIPLSVFLLKGGFLMLKASFIRGLLEYGLHIPLI